MTTRRVPGVLAAVVIAALAGGTTAASARTTTTTAAPTPTSTSPRKACTDATASLRPDPVLTVPSQMPEGTSLRAILDDKRLVVGVDENTMGFSARNPDTGEIEGFEADLARAIAAEIFGDDKHIKLVTVTTPEKFDVVKDSRVDMTISVASMSCSRWQDGVDFSTAYFEAFQQLLVRGDSMIRGQRDLPGKRVCVTKDSSSEKFVREELPETKAVPVETRTNCLVKLQESQVDAVLLPSSIQAGLHVQDPTTVLLPERLLDRAGKPAINTYGIVIDERRPDLTRYVNGLLQRWRADGRLVELQVPLGKVGLPISVPDANYKD